MKLKYNSLLSVLFFICFFTSVVFSQKKKPTWKEVSKKELKRENLLSNSKTEKVKYYTLDIDKLKTNLTAATKRKDKNQFSELIIDFPDGNGIMNQYRVREASVMSPKLQEKYPEFRSFVGQNIKDSNSTIRFSITTKGLNAMVFSPQNGMQYIDPSKKEKNIYEVLFKSDLKESNRVFECGFKDENFQINRSNLKSRNNANDGMMREFRLALATTVEYSAFHIAAAEAACGCTLTTDAQKKAAVMAELVMAMTRVNFIYERELSLTMKLVPNNDLIVFIDSDDYTNDGVNFEQLSENQTVIDNVIGFSNYDIGHVFTTSDGGAAIPNSPCKTDKAAGYTGLGTPVGDPFYVDYVTHEMGHQYGAFHTFNGTAGSCAGNNRQALSAYEPGSGSTIMGYAGICSPQNVQANSDAYFHQKSLQMIWDNITSPTGSNCASLTSTGNSVPTAEAGNPYTIPGQTPYKLLGSSMDVDGTTTHTYTWEQYDLGAAQAGVLLETATTGPLLRSFEGTNDPIRIIPNLMDLNINGGESTSWEKLASVNRDINFQLTVRDNDSRGGQTATDNVTITVDANSGPFRVTSQSVPAIKWESETTETINWDVANTSSAPINTDKVNILLSIDGGATYSMLLANTDNDGTENIIVPNTPAPYCRIKVEAVDNIYFAINRFDFAINYTVSSETTCNTFSSTEGLNISIPDNTGETMTHSIHVNDSKEIDYVSVNVDVDHTYINDLTIQIHHPDGTTISKLWNKDCDSEDNLDITFKDGNPSVVCAQPTVGNFMPSTSLNVFSGLNSAGNWSISIIDDGAGDIGTLTDWSIEICTTETIILNVKEDVFEGFKIFPNPSNGLISISLLADQEDYIEIDLFDITGRLIKSRKFTRINQNFNKQFNYGSVSTGIYILKVSQGNKTESKRIVIN